MFQLATEQLETEKIESPLAINSSDVAGTEFQKAQSDLEAERALFAPDLTKIPVGKTVTLSTGTYLKTPTGYELLAPKQEEKPEEVTEEKPQEEKPLLSDEETDILAQYRKSLEEDFAEDEKTINEFTTSAVKGIDEDTKRVIEEINQKYTRILQNTAQMNKQIEGATTVGGFTSGRTRYTPSIQKDILKNVIEQGKQRIEEIDSERERLINVATQAGKDKAYKAVFDSMEELRELRKEKNDQIFEIQKQVIEAEKEVSRQNKELRDSIKQELDNLDKLGDSLAHAALDAVSGLDENASRLVLQGMAMEYADFVDPLAFSTVLDSKVKKLQKEKEKYPAGDIGEFMFANEQRIKTGKTPFKTLEEYQIEQERIKSLFQKPTKKTVSEMEAETVERVRAVKFDDPDFVLKTIDASKGGKIAAAEERRSITKAAIVLNQLGELQDNLKKLESDELQPIVGQFTKRLPWAELSQTIQGQITSILPNLARGIYGEVGVLTDTDIARYEKTLPNLTSTEGVRKALMAITVRTAFRSMEEQLTTMAALGIDVSGMRAKYQQLQKKSEKLDADIGATGRSVKLKDPKTGVIRTFDNLSSEDLQEALNKGFIQQ